MKDRVIILTALVLAVFAAALCYAIYTAPAAPANNTIPGKAIFNPANFSMATYIEASSVNNTTMQFILLSYPGEPLGNRLTSVEVSSQGSLRGDIWIDRSGLRTNKVVTTYVTPESIDSHTLNLPYNLTVLDNAWNTMDTVYTLIGYDNITVPAGQFDGCAVYAAKKILVSNGQPENMTVYYYLYPSVPVPVLYAVETPSEGIMYGLKSSYGPRDVDSSPERVIQSYLDRLNESAYTQAAQLLVKVDADGNISPLSRQDVLKLADNMVQTYGQNGGNMIVQYVSVDTVEPIDNMGGDRAVTAHWTSVQYMPSRGLALSIDKTSKVVEVNGHWKILADDL